VTLRAVADNDILIKGACYHLLSKMVTALPLGCEEVGFLGATPFVARKKIRRARLNKKSAFAIRDFENAMARMTRVEPTHAEIAFAADLELLAQKANLALDFGESQLCAIVSHRRLDWLVTGDKRAIRAIQSLWNAGAEIQYLEYKIVCLEQLFFAIVAFCDTGIERLICSEPNVDKAISISFSCSSKVRDVKSWLVGLRSYIEHLRSVAPTMLSNN
jgi:hypothetical protein